MSILNPLFEAVAWVLIKIHAGLSVPFGQDSGLTWALSIIILVMGMRLVMLPLFVKQVKSQQRMQAHMPKMREIQKKYKHDKQRQQEEMMKLYRENGINPLGGCLPLVAQLPVFWSLFNVLKAIAEYKGGAPQYHIPIKVIHSALRARVFGASLADKILFTGPGQHVPLAAKLVILVFVVVSATTTYLTMRQSQKRGMMQQGPVDPDNPAANMQKYMIYIAPLFALSGLYWQFGLVIYWVTTNVWTLAQQHFLFRNLPVVGADADSASAPAGGTKTTAAKSVPAKTSAAAKAGTGTKTGTAAKSGTAAKTGGAKTAAAKSGANGANGTAVTAKTAKDSEDGSGGRNLLRFGKSKAEPEPEPVAETKIQRQQPVRQTRSKRSGKK